VAQVWRSTFSATSEVRCAVVSCAAEDTAASAFEGAEETAMDFNTKMVSHHLDEFGGTTMTSETSIWHFIYCL